LRLTPASSGVALDIDAGKGGSWTAVAGSERSSVAVFASTQAWGPVLHSRNRTIYFSQKLVDAGQSGGVATVVLSGRAGSHSAEQRITFAEDDAFINVQVRLSLGKPVRVGLAGSPFIFIPDGKLYPQYAPVDFCWIPHLRRRADHVIADQVFRSPAVVLQSGGTGVALAPDLDTLSSSRPLPAALDMRLDNPGVNAPAMWYGFCPYRVDGHVFFRHELSRFEPVKGELEYGFDIIAATGLPAGGAARMALAHLWRKYGSRLIDQSLPQALEFEEYARLALSYAYDRADIWREFETGGVCAGGTLALTYAGPNRPSTMGRRETQAFIKMSKYFPSVHGTAVETLLARPGANDLMEMFMQAAPPPVPPQVLFQAWFNNLRSAYGAYDFGKKWNDDALVEKALKTKELALAAPGEGGFMSSMCYCPEGGEPFWVQGSKAFQPVREYHLPDNAWTGWWMLRWHEELEADGRLMERAEALGAAFMDHQLESGAIPGWVRVRPSGAVASSVLRESAQTAAPGMFLALLGRLSGDRKTLSAAKKAAGFLIENIFPRNRWWDYETFFSCSKKDFGMRDTGTGIECMNNLCIFWTAELMRELAVATGEKKYMDYGRRAVDLMLFWQQVWDAPYISINTFGGFGVMNTDAEWNDARQSAFAESLLGWYELTGERELFERGIAALRASFTTMLVPEHDSVAPGNNVAYRKKDEGAVYENYAHMGFDRRVTGYVMFDWGGGGACTAAARAAEKYGDVYVDAVNREAFGIDLCSARLVSAGEKSISIEVESPVSQKRTVCVKISGLKSGRYTLRVNGGRAGTFSASKLLGGVGVEV